ncbi:MAG: DMT family transporter [Caldilineaceae bacterium]|nr:DMT family transporter [Caldilineaceae bacterium]
MPKALASNASQLDPKQVTQLTLLLLFDSLHFIFARLLLPYVSPDVSVMYVMSIATLQVGIYGWVTGQLRWAPLRDHWRFFLVIGVLIGFSTHLAFVAIAYIDVGTAAMLGQIATVFGVAFGLIWLREHFSMGQLVGTAVAVVGSVVIAYQPDAQLQWGALLIIAGSFCYSLHFAIVKRHGSTIDFLNFFFYRVLGTAVMLVLSVAGRQVFSWPSWQGWGMILLTATIDVTISRIFYYQALRRLNMSLLSVISTLSPVAAILWAFLLFGTWPTGQQWLGGVGVLVGVLVVTICKERR